MFPHFVVLLYRDLLINNKPTDYLRRVSAFWGIFYTNWSLNRRRSCWAFVFLGKLMEEKLRQALILSRGRAPFSSAQYRRGLLVDLPIIEFYCGSSNHQERARAGFSRITKREQVVVSPQSTRQVVTDMRGFFLT